MVMLTESISPFYENYLKFPLPLLAMGVGMDSDCGHG